MMKKNEPVAWVPGWTVNRFLARDAEKLVGRDYICFTDVQRTNSTWGLSSFHREVDSKSEQGEANSEERSPFGEIQWTKKINIGYLDHAQQ
jgi:hypothetical protein